MELPRAVWGPGEQQGENRGCGRTFPDAGPEDVAVVNVHHDPLTVERILVHGARW